jgi:ribonuclease P protein component
MKDFSYSKKERLCSKILIDRVFNEGFKVNDSNLKAIWLPCLLPEDVPVQTLVTVPWRKFRRANKRNLLKRRIKEAFRHSKHLLYQPVSVSNLQIALVLLYQSGRIKDYSEIEKSIHNIISGIRTSLRINILQ